MTILPFRVQAEDYDDIDTWIANCSDITKLQGEMREDCSEFILYLSSKSEDLKDELKKIDSSKQTTLDSIQAYETKLTSMQDDINVLNGDISSIKDTIESNRQAILTLTEKEATLKERVVSLMKKNQGTMRINKVFDVLFGAKSFADLLRLANGIKDITLFQNQVIQSYVDTKNNLLSKQKQLEENESSLKSKQEDMFSTIYKLQTVAQDYQLNYAELASKQGEIQSVQSKYLNDLSTLDEVQKEAIRIEELARQAAIQKAEEERQRQEALKQEQEKQQAQQEQTQPQPSETPEVEEETETLPSVYVASNAKDIYITLINTYGFNKAAAVGIVANIQIESMFNPTAGSTYYGLCQWGGSRKEQLFAYLSANGYSTDSVAGQLAYMYHELENYQMVSVMNGFANSEDGAREAGIYFRQKFERSAGLDNVGNIAAGYYHALG